jgi:2-iminobutanoate/2-iminopropanoate deaminase
MRRNRSMTLTKRPMHVPHMLNEAYEYERPVPFSRGTRLDFGNLSALLISGTASVDESGMTVHVGDLRAQVRRTFANVTELLASEGMTWQDVVHTRIYLRDIDRDYDALREERLRFFEEQGVQVFPASCCVEARLCRPDLLVEMEVVALREAK